MTQTRPENKFMQKIYKRIEKEDDGKVNDFINKRREKEERRDMASPARGLFSYIKPLRKIALYAALGTAILGFVYSKFNPEFVDELVFQSEKKIENTIETIAMKYYLQSKIKEANQEKSNKKYSNSKPVQENKEEESPLEEKSKVEESYITEKKPVKKQEPVNDATLEIIINMSKDKDMTLDKAMGLLGPKITEKYQSALNKYFSDN